MNTENLASAVFEGGHLHNPPKRLADPPTCCGGKKVKPSGGNDWRFLC